MPLLVIEKCRKLEQLFEKNLQNFETLNRHEPGTSNAAILVFSMGSDIYSILWLEFITFTNSMTR
jgi:hypothetical protein